MRDGALPVASGRPVPHSTRFPPHCGAESLTGGRAPLGSYGARRAQDRIGVPALRHCGEARLDRWRRSLRL